MGKTGQVGTAGQSGQLSEGTAADPYRGALKGLRGPLLATFAFSAAINVLMLTGSIYMLQIYDRVLASGSIPTLVALFCIVIVLYGFLGFYDITRRRLLARGATRLDIASGGAAFGLWLRSGLPSAAGAGGDARALRDLETVRGFASGGAITALFDLPFVPIFLGVLFLLHPWLGWLTVGGAAVSVGLAMLNRQLTRAPLEAATEAEAGERDFSEASRQSAEAIAAMGMGGAVARRWRALHDRALLAGQAGSDPSEALAAASRAFRMLLQSAILSLGAVLVILGEISGGMIIASSILSGRALAPIDQVIGQWRVIGKAWQAHQRLLDCFARQPAAAETLALPDPAGRIEVKALTKRFPGTATGADRPPLMDAVSFALEPGEALGVVGPSGSGKTTLGRLLTGAWTPDSGEVRLDGATFDQWTPERLGRLIGYLPQRIELLPGTIRENISRFDPEATDEAVIAAAQMGGLHEMILRLPEGYATRVGSTGGAALSGGQMQRLGLARAVYGQPKLVVLDEPNANLDTAGDAALTQAIRALRASGAAVVVMAHRPSALAAVSQVMVLENGAVSRIGPRDEILGPNGRLPAAARDRTAKRRLPLRLVSGDDAPRPDNEMPAGAAAKLPPAPAQSEIETLSVSERLSRLAAAERRGGRSPVAPLLKRKRAE